MTNENRPLRRLEVTFEADGAVKSDGGLEAAVDGGDVSDLFLFAHGWNADVDSARRLNTSMFDLLASALGVNTQRALAAGIIWPAAVFPEDDPTSSTGTPSSGAELASALKPAFPPDQEAPLDAMGHLLDTTPPSGDALMEFHDLAKGLVTSPPIASEDAGQGEALVADTATVFGHAAAMSKAPEPDTEGSGNPFSGLWKGAREVLRTLSYYEMKNRAGVIGSKGLGPLIGRLAKQSPGLRIHLLGHSFGARLVSFALAGLPDAGVPTPVRSLTLIQGAFSHFSFAQATRIPNVVPSGYLAKFVERVDGPLLATFSASDRALGWWYPAASMLANQNSESVSDLTYEWGALGHDAFQQLPTGTSVSLGPAGTTSYTFTSSEFYLLDANSVICHIQDPFSGAHSDIQHPEVLWAVASAAGLAHVP